MTDLVVTVPKGIWFDWIAEGDAVGEPDSGEEWAYFLGGFAPTFVPGARLYIVAWNQLRGYAPITRIEKTASGFGICRRGGAVAVTIAAQIPGFRGYRRRWWLREDERPFEDWRCAGVSERLVERARATGVLR